MKFQPKSHEEIEKEAAARGPLKPGVYDFETTFAGEKLSQSGNEMIELELRVYDGDGGSRKMRDYLVSTPGMAYKLRHFCESVGLADKYECGEIQDFDLDGTTGKVRLGLERQAGYAERNKVVDYVVDAGAPKSARVSPERPAARPAERKPAMVSADPFEDDEIPF